MDEKADFKVIEFNKEEKKLIVSHTKIWEEPKPGDKELKEEKSAKTSGAKAAVKSTQKPSEKTTLGDISALAGLKEEMEAKAKGKAKKNEEGE